MTRRALAAILLAAATMPLAACAGNYGYGTQVAYGPGPYSYDGYYDGYYGNVYDGYWGDDDNFYYRRGANDRAFVRGDRSHFAREAPQGQQGQGGRSYQQLHGSMTPGQGMRMPHFPSGGGGGGHGGGGGGGGGHHP